MRWVLGAAAGVALGIGLVLLFGDRGDVRPPPATSLLREQSLLTFARQADLDGDEVPEVIVASRSKLFTHFELPPQYLDVFAYREGSWRRIFDATREAPAGGDGPDRMLDTPAVERISRLVDSVHVTDVDGDGASELVAGILTVGAGPGPLELWVASLDGEDLRADFYARTTRGGEISVEGDRIVFRFPVYRPRDPGCCPTWFERQVIGFDEESRSVGVLRRERTKAPRP